MLGLALVGAASGAFYYRRWQSALAAAKTPPRLEAIAPETRRLETTVTATGIVRLKTGAEVRVGSQVSGVVTRLNVSVGSHVNAGDIIAAIQSRGLDERIAAATAQTEIDETALHKIEREWKRSRELLAYGLVARQQTEDLEEDFDNAQARLAKSRKDLAVVESDLPFLEIRAPITGTVASVSTLQGETVAASFAAPTFVTIIADNALELVAMVDETDIGGVRPRQPVTFTIETYPSREFHGVVERVAPKGTIVAGVVNYEVGVALGSGMSALKPDMTANVTIRTAGRQALLIPDRAVHREGEQTYAIVTASGAKRRLVLGSREGTWVEVRSGLDANDRVFILSKEPGK